jgi:hypothetical protein
VLRDKVLRIRVTAESLAELGLDDQDIEASLDVDDHTVDQLRAGLRRIMAYGRADARPATIEL